MCNTIMRANRKNGVLFIFLSISSFYSCNGCWIEGVGGVELWAVGTSTDIKDTFRGNVYDRATRDIEGIVDHTFIEGLNGGPYFTVSHENSRFVIATNDAFEDYEEYETLEELSVTLVFRCTGGSTGILIFLIQLQDTNNNAPRFLSTNDFAYTITTPVPPGFLITECSGITVRDVDLTTQKIDFTIQDNPYFEIEYNGDLLTDVKEFKGVLRTKTFIRTLPDSITLTITATDVDLTGDPQLHTTVNITFIANSEYELPDEPVFSQAFYLADYNDIELVFNETIYLQSGYDEQVVFSLEETEFSHHFEAVPYENRVLIKVIEELPTNVLRENQILLIVRADREYTSGATATILVQLPEVLSLEFEKAHYEGAIVDNNLRVPELTLSQGYEGQTIHVNVFGEYGIYFNGNAQGNSITLSMENLPQSIINENNVISLEIVASAEFSTARAIVTLEIIKDDNVTPVFNKAVYAGSYTTETGLIIEPIVLNQGYEEPIDLFFDEDEFSLFTVKHDGPIVTVATESIPPEIFYQERIVLVLRATKPRTVGATAIIDITLPAEHAENAILSFDQFAYTGTFNSSGLDLEPITLIQGFTSTVSLTLHGDLEDYFAATWQGAGGVSVTLSREIPHELLPANRIIVLQIQASEEGALSAYATIVIEVVAELSAPRLVFDASYYTGTYTSGPIGLVMDTAIILAEGNDATVEYDVEGDHSQWFAASGTGDYVTLTVRDDIPNDILVSNHLLILVLTADRPGSDTARATIVISVNNDSQIGDDVSFDKLVYEGIIQLSTVQHELIIISNYIGVTVDVHGEHSNLFVARVADGVVTVQTSGSLTLPSSVTTVILELHAESARAVLLLNAELSEAPLLPTVTFSSPSYAVNVQIVQTGLVGRVSATADNGEAITYSLAIDNEHLQARISINNMGELHLSAPANSGVYSFQVVATTVVTQAEGRATIHLTVEAITVCGDNDIVVPPLIILDRDEEEPHNNLVTLSQYENCQFTLTNRWPLNQNWLYVDGNGLHARSIDREHESIAHMAQSQVRVELILHCENDNVSRTKRSLRTDWLGPYDYGSNEWILTESISYNSRRSFVNLIVNDINDNYPIFVGKEREPIVVGYPNAELEGRILPRSLAELQATDADIGENAALRYWSSEDVLAVAPTTGFVHVRTGARVENDQRLTINATDQNGQGLTGSIQLQVKILDLNNIVIITVRNTFLHDESTVLAQLSEAIGYEIKVLKSIVVSNNFGEDDNNISRKRRETEVSGPSLLLYVYGLLQSEPVSVDRLTTDINTNAEAVNIISTVSLEDHLEPDEIIISENSIGLLVSTIVLGVLLFILVVLIAIWFLLKWRKNRNYEAFSDANSLASRTDSVDQLPKLETSKPRLNIEDLKRSERRLQDMLNAPIREVTVEAIPARLNPPIVDLLSPESNIPIVVQSFDKLKSSEESDDDEFGEMPATKKKSVVTFNENVENIIHVEDDPLDTTSSTSSYESYKF